MIGWLRVIPVRQIRPFLVDGTGDLGQLEIGHIELLSTNTRKRTLTFLFLVDMKNTSLLALVSKVTSSNFV